MKRALIFLLVFCMVVFIASFFVAVSKESTASYSLAGVSFVCFVALYAAGILGYKVGGSHLSLEAKVEALESKNTELQESVTALLKAIYVLSHAETPMAGPSNEQYSLIDQYLSPIKHLVIGDVKASVDSDIQSAHENRHH